MQDRGRVQERERKLEQIFLRFKEEVLHYAMSLIGEHRDAEVVVKRAFTRYFEVFTSQTPVENARLELLQTVWKHVLRTVRGAKRLESKEALQSVLALQQYGLSLNEIKRVMGMSSEKIKTIRDPVMLEHSEISLVEQEQAGISSNIFSTLCVDDIWMSVKSERRNKRRKRFTLGVTSFLIVVLIGVFAYKESHRTTEQSQISIEHPLHLQPKGSVVHSISWLKGATFEGWQNTVTGETKTVLRDGDQTKVTYTTSTYRYLQIYLKGTLQSTHKEKVQEKEPPLLQKVTDIQDPKASETVYHGIPVTIYSSDTDEYYVDKENQLLLVMKSKGEAAGSTSATYYGYEYLQSVGYDFFEPPIK